jgi:histidinol phosphatase-like PHP family hydrolase
MKLRCDWHMHSHHSPCGKDGATLALIRDQVRAAGVVEFGITDHLHCRGNEPALRSCRAEYDALPDRKGFHFGLEVSCVRRYDLEAVEDGALFPPDLRGGPEDDELLLHLPEDLLAELEVEYVVAGTHWPLGAPEDQQAMIRSYHRQNMFLARHPKVDIVAHPWWWMGAWKQPGTDREFYPDLPWLGDFSVIPRSMHDEFADAARENGKAVEINADACLLNPRYPDSFRGQYLEYLAGLRERGVRFSIGSDSHHAGYDGALAHIGDDLEELGIDPAELWRPGSRGAENTPCD